MFLDEILNDINLDLMLETHSTTNIIYGKVLHKSSNDVLVECNNNYRWLSSKSIIFETETKVIIPEYLYNQNFK